MFVDDGGLARTQIILTQRGLVEPDKVRFWIELEPRASWELGFDVVPSLDGGELGAHVVKQRFGEERDRIEASLAAWNLRVPQAARVVGRPRSRLPAVRRRPRVASAPGRREDSGTCRPPGCRGS